MTITVAYITMNKQAYVSTNVEINKFEKSHDICGLVINKVIFKEFLKLPYNKKERILSI